ncbi:MAG: hypothetical protein KTR17_01545 [Cellvibrionaceae bacterium]|nr:hypothetical protein [Cellvibrionaceae bacterium]
MSESPKVDRHRYMRICLGGKAPLYQDGELCASPALDVPLKGLPVVKPVNDKANSKSPGDIQIELTDKTPIRLKALLIPDSESVLGFKSESIDINRDSLALETTYRTEYGRTECSGTRFL